VKALPAVLGALLYNPIPLAVVMSRFRTSLASILTLALGTFVAFACDAAAIPTVTARLVSLERTDSKTVHVTLRTQEGLERFVFAPHESATTTTEEVHFSGYARPRNFQREKLPAALTIADRRAWIFYTSRRTGRPAAAIVSLTRADSNLITKRVRVSRVPEKTLECGSHGNEHADEPSTSAASRKRRVNRSSGGKFGANRAGLFSPARVLEVATEADYEFRRIHGDDTNTYIRAVLNAVDTIYASSLGVRVKIVSQRVSSSPTGRRGSIDALNLLEEFRQGAFASNSPADVRHLFTGRSVEGLTIGIAYVAAACTHGGRYGVGLSRDVSAGLQPFLAAHELAHNLSATHDGEANSIMNPAITEANNRFTSRALTSIYNFVTSTGSCLGSELLSPATITLDSTDPTRFNAQVTFTTTGSSSCSVILYGSGDGRRYTPISTRNLGRATTSTARVASFAAEAPPLTSTQSFYFKAKVVCGSSRTISAPAKLRYGLATSGTTNTSSSSRWLEGLKRNLR
jgi:hypothetical protein